MSIIKKFIDKTFLVISMIYKMEYLFVYKEVSHLQSEVTIAINWFILSVYTVVFLKNNSIANDLITSEAPTNV